MLTSRYTLPVIALLLVALIPTVIHNYLGLTAEDDFSVSKIPATLDTFDSNPSNRLSTWGKETFDCYDWTERMYTDGDGSVIRLFVGKSYDHKRLYHHPELALSYGISMTKDGIIPLTADGNIPVNVLRHTNNEGLAAYALWYDGHFIENPIQHQIKDTLKLLVSPKKPMTLFYVSEIHSSQGLPFQKTKSAQLLLKAIQSVFNSLQNSTKIIYHEIG